MLGGKAMVEILYQVKKSYIYRETALVKLLLNKPPNNQTVVNQTSHTGTIMDKNSVRVHWKFPECPR